jgi:hypothetical protein
MRNTTRGLLALGTLLTGTTLGAQRTGCHPTLAPRSSSGGPQIADTSYRYRIASPAFAPGAGPAVLLDEAHANFHTVDGRYAPFATLLRGDGFVVRPSRTRFTAATLAGVRLLVIANALAEQHRQGSNWVLPAASAFTADEIRALRQWVEQGGALLLIADHMPFGGDAADLARAFGIEMLNGFATDAACAADEFLFQRADSTLGDHVITRGRNAAERIDAVRSFTGQAFRVRGNAQSVLRVPRGTTVLMPQRAWAFSDSTPVVRGDDLSQGAVLTVGRGRVAVFGEAAMFSAQVSGTERRPMGMNAPNASQNPQFLLNVMRWLAGALPAR